MVAVFVFTHGPTPLFHGCWPLRSKKHIDQELLQSTLDKALPWYASLLQSVVDHDSLPHMAERRALGAKTKCPAQEQRRQSLRQAIDEKRRGRALARARDEGKRRYEDMSATEQQLLEAYDTGATEKKRKRHLVPAQPPFRGDVTYSDRFQ